MAIGQVTTGYVNCSRNGPAFRSHLKKKVKIYKKIIKNKIQKKVKNYKIPLVELFKECYDKTSKFYMRTGCLNILPFQGTYYLYVYFLVENCKLKFFTKLPQIHPCNTMWVKEIFTFYFYYLLYFTFLFIHILIVCYKCHT